MDEKKKILLEISSIAIGKIPKSYVEFGELIWKVFHLGEKAEQLKNENKNYIAE